MKNNCSALNHFGAVQNQTSSKQSTNQGNGSEITFLTGPTKINFKNLKTLL